MLWNEMSPPEKWHQSVKRYSWACGALRFGKGGREERSQQYDHATSHTHRHLFQGAGPPANSLGKAFKCFIVVWIFQLWEFSSAKLTDWNLHFMFYGLTPRYTFTLPIASKNKTKQCQKQQFELRCFGSRIFHQCYHFLFWPTWQNLQFTKTWRDHSSFPITRQEGIL